MTTFSIALRNVARQRSRALLTLASVGLGVASLMLAAGFVDDVLAQLREATIRSQLGHFEVFAPGYVDGGRTDPLAHTIDDPAKAIAELRRIPGVSVVAPRLSLTGLASNGRTDRAVAIDGVDPQAEARIGEAVATVSGRALAMPAANAAAPAIAGEGLARSLGLEVDEPLTLLMSTKHGALNTLDTTLSGVFRSPFKDYDDRAVRITLRDAQALAATDAVNEIAVLLAPDADVDDAVRAARRALPASRYDVRPWWDLADFYQGTASLYRRQFLVLLVIVSLMVLLGVANSINMSLHERQAEFGTVRALGYGPDVVFRQIVVESAMLGAAGIVGGLAIGALVALAVSAIGIPMPPPPNSSVSYVVRIGFSGWGIALSCAAALVASIAGAILPARRLMRMPIVDALRHAV
jgi:putative ABC transport system permease protein